MDEPREIPDLPEFHSSEEPSNAAGGAVSEPLAELPAVEVFPVRAHESGPAPAAIHDAARQRNFRRNLYSALGLALVAFTLTSWILVRIDFPFGVFATGPQDVVRAQLRDLDRGQLKPAYDLFSPRYRSQVSFDAWHELCIAHWRMFHANVIRADQPEPRGAGVFLEIYLRGADATNYRARFTVIRADGRWWIDDVHWTEEPSAREFWRT